MGVVLALMIFYCKKLIALKRATSSESNVREALRVQRNVYESGITFAALCFLRRAYHLLRDNVDHLIDLERNAVEREATSFVPPPKNVLSLATSVYKSICDPKFLGLENVPTLDEEGGPLLFVSNHAILALELPLLLEGMYTRKNMWLRPLADHAHFQIPVTGSVLRNIFGCVDGTPRNVEILFSKRQAVLVYPGGARETFKRKSDRKYELKWSDRSGFARLAVEHGCTIIPVSNVGTEDMVHILTDVPLSHVPIPFLFGSDRTFPLIAPPTIGDLQRIYFKFGKPIRTKRFGGVANESNVSHVRDETKHAIESGIRALLRMREDDTSRFSVDRVSKAATKRAKLLVEWIQKKAPRTSGDTRSAL